MKQPLRRLDARNVERGLESNGTVRRYEERRHPATSKKSIRRRPPLLDPPSTSARLHTAAADCLRRMAHDGAADQGVTIASGAAGRHFTM